VNGVSGLQGVNAVQVAPDGAHVYAVGSTFSALTTFGRDAGTGALTFQGIIRDDQDGVVGIGGAGDVAIRPDGHEILVSGPGDSALVAFGRNAASGALVFHEAVFDGNGAAGLADAAGVAISPDGAHVYVAGISDNAVAVFAIQAP
jgi:6-phosphogluconolactonase (cycloisomerase 2 family)